MHLVAGGILLLLKEATKRHKSVFVPFCGNDQLWRSGGIGIGML
jgi:hypothetical protein